MSSYDHSRVQTLDLSTAVVASFLQALDPTAQAFTFQLFHETNKSQPPVVLHGSLDELQSELMRYNNLGYGVFVTVNETDGLGRKASNIQQVRALFVDFDDKEVLPEPHLKPSIVVQSSENHKQHWYWLVGDCPLDKFSEYQQRLASFYGSDAVVKDLSRVMRVPGFLHQKAEPKVVQLLDANGRVYEADSVMLGIPTDRSTAAQRGTDRSTAGTNKHKVLKELCTAVSKAKEGTRNKKVYDCALVAKAKGLDMDEVVQQFAMWSELDEAEVQRTVQSAWTVENLQSYGDDKQTDEQKVDRVMDGLYANSFRYNELKETVLLEGKQFDIDKLTVKVQRELRKEHGIGRVSKSQVRDNIMALAYENSYNPVTDYLDSLPTDVDVDVTIGNLLTEVLGVQASSENYKLYEMYIKRWLVGAVSRAYNPGCKVDAMLVLKGRQNAGKSGFFAALFDEFYENLSTWKSDVDVLLTLRQSWVTEFAELEAVTSTKDSAFLKNFITCPDDNYRAPYAAKTESHKRKFVLCGTTNREQFLHDETGSRRFFVIELPSAVNFDALNRDDIWSSAVCLYKSGYSPLITEGERQALEKANRKFQLLDPWTYSIEDWLGNLPDAMRETDVTIANIINRCLNIPATNSNRSTQMRIATVLATLGFECKQKRVDGRVTRVYVAPPSVWQELTQEHTEF